MYFSRSQTDNIYTVAKTFGLSAVLARAGEEFAEATTAVLQYKRAAVDNEGDLEQRRAALVDELADQAIMAEQLFDVIPNLREAVRDRANIKIHRTFQRYGIRNVVRWKDPAESD